MRHRKGNHDRQHDPALIDAWLAREWGSAAVEAGLRAPGVTELCTKHRDQLARRLREAMVEIWTEVRERSEAMALARELAPLLGPLFDHIRRIPGFAESGHTAEEISVWLGEAMLEVYDGLGIRPCSEP